MPGSPFPGIALTPVVVVILCALRVSVRGMGVDRRRGWSSTHSQGVRRCCCCQGLHVAQHSYEYVRVNGLLRAHVVRTRSTMKEWGQHAMASSAFHVMAWVRGRGRDAAGDCCRAIATAESRGATGQS